MAILALIGTPDAAMGTVSGMAMGVVGAEMASSTQKRTGSYSMRLKPTSAQSVYFGKFGTDGKKTDLAGLSTIYISFYLYIATAPAADEKLLAVCSSTTYGTNEVVRLEYVQASNTLKLVGSTTSSTTAALSTATWYRVDIKSVNSGTCELQLDLATAVTCTGNAGGTNCRVHVGTNGTDANLDCYFDDMVISDSAITTSPYRIGKLSPNADGSGYTAWTASAGNKWDCVDEIPSSATEYIASGTGAGDQRYSAALESAATGGISTGFTIHAVQGEFRMFEAASTTTLAAVGIRGGSTDAETSNVDIGTSANIIMGIVRETNPDDSAAWEPADLDSMELIVKRSTSDTSDIRCAWMVAEVMYTPLHTSTSALVLPFPVLSATGVKKYPGTAALKLPFPVLTATGLLRDIASGTLTLPFPVMVGTGLYTPNTVTGTGALTLPFPVLASSGVMRPKGVSALVLPFPVLTATGLKVYEGIGALTLPFPVMVASGAQKIRGTSSLVLPFPTLVSSGVVRAFGTGSLVLPFPVMSATGIQLITSTSALVLPFPIMSASGTHTYYRGNAVLTLPFPVLYGVGQTVFPPSYVYVGIAEIPQYIAQMSIPSYNLIVPLPNVQRVTPIEPQTEITPLPNPSTVRSI